MKKIFKSKVFWLGLTLFLFVIVSILCLQYFNKPQKEFQKKIIKIGAVLPLTGKNAVYGKYIKNAIEIAINDKNSKDTLNKFEVIFEDDQAKPQMGANAIDKLINQNNTSVVFGSWASSSTLAMAPIAEKNKVILMAEAISPKIKNAGEYIYRIQPDATLYINHLVTYIKNNMQNIKKVAILYVNNDFGSDQAKLFEDKFKGKNRKILFFDGFDQGTSDFKTIILKIKKLNVDAVFIPAYSEIINFLKQSREMGLNVQIFGSVPSENPNVIKIAGKAAEGLIYPHHFSEKNNNPKFLKFKNKYKQKYGEDPEGFACLAYDGFNILMDASKNCKNTKCIKNYLDTINYSGINGKIKFDKYGDPDIDRIYIKTIKNGKFITIE